MRKLHGDWRDIFYCFGIALLSPLKLRLSLSACITITTGSLAITLFAAALFHTDGADFDSVYELSLHALHGVFTLDSEPVFEALRLAYHVPRQMHSLFGLAGCFSYGLLLFPWFWLVSCHYGAAVSRLAAFNISRDTEQDGKDVKAYIKKNFKSYFWPPILVLVFIAFFILWIAVPALLTQIDVIAPIVKILSAVFFPLMLFAAFLAAVFMVGGFFGWVFIIPTISVEGTDIFDALSRSFSYVMQKPLLYFCYTVLAICWGIATWLVISYFGQLVTDSALLGLKIGLSENTYHNVTDLVALRSPITQGEIPFSDIALGTSVFICFTVFNLFLASYAFSYFFTASTMIYLLIRKKVDGIGMDQIYVEGENTPSPKIAEIATGDADKVEN